MLFMTMFNKYVLSPIIDSIINYSDHNSFFINNTWYSYNDFARSISKIRSCIQKSSFTGKNIGLIVNDDLETYASIIAIWLECYTYVPIHPKHPTERGLEIIKQAGIDLIIDSSDVSVFSSRTIIPSGKLEYNKMNIIPDDSNDSENAYILFTSGSTGKPKGVPITRGNLATFMKAFWEVGLIIDENDRCLQCFDLTFDVSIQSFLVPLSKGACTFTIPHDQIKPSYASDLLEEHRLTFGAMAPSMIRFLRPYFDEINLPSMRYNILTAEASPLDLVEEWSKCIPNAEIYDFYGPTEATIYCTYSKFSRNNVNKHLNGMLSIGKPLNGISAIIIDEELNILPDNTKGELCVSGDQVTEGYWENTEKNRIAFIVVNLNGELRRFYKTGDLCYFDNDGDLMYAGRLDSQVKIQGFRIELGEIEHIAREYLKKHDVIAVGYNNNLGHNEIALFIEGEIVDISLLLVYLKAKLPYYMIPSKVIIIKDFPLNSNGKVDRKSLINRLTN